jgi:AmmeMemoRadiSam system protein B
MSGGVIGPAVAGRWYAASEAQLEREVEGLFARATPRRDAPPAPPSLSAVIAPHAGFQFSGAVAASAFRALRDRPIERVLLLGPSHYERFDGCALPDAAAYRTPLGDVPIDRDATARLGRAPGFRVDSRPFAPEHSLEAELPFLQRALPRGFHVVPVLVGGGASAASLAGAAAALAALVGPGTLTVVSSDFTHYGERFGYVPFTGHVEPRVRELDMRAVEHIVALDRAGFENYATRTGITICGRAAIEILLRLLPAGTRGQLADYDTSGRQTGDWDHTVSYASLLFGPAPDDAPRC